MKNLVLCGAVLVLLSGCTVARKMSFEHVKVSERVLVPARPFDISVVDQREKVITGKRKSTWSGSMLSTAQLDYPANTSTGKPLAEEFAIALRNSIDPEGRFATLAITDPFTDSAAYFTRLAGKPESRLIQMTIMRWDPTLMPRFIDIKYYCDYNLVLKVYGAGGELMAQAFARDHWELIETSLAGTLKKLQGHSSALLEQQLALLLRDEGIRKALQ